MLSRREFFKAFGFAGIVAALGGLGSASGCASSSTPNAASGQHYTFTVVSGATITQSNAQTGKYKYKRHCDTCGWEELMSRSVSAEDVNDSFTCPRCGSFQVVKITVALVSD